MSTREGPGRECRHPELRGCRGLRTLGDALQARDELETVSPYTKPDRDSYPDSVECHVVGS
jgi:hypothetical protein